MERKSFKWMIVDLMFMYIVTGLGLILMAFLMEKFQLNGKIPVGTVIRKPVLFDLVCRIGSIGRKASERSGTYGNDTWDLYGGRNTWGHDELKNAFQLKNIML